jgi:biotin carboxylase
MNARELGGRKRILILGGNRSNLLSVRAAKRAGFVTYVADPRPEASCLQAADYPLRLDVLEPESILSAVQQAGGVDGVVSTSEVGVEAAVYISRKLGIRSISEVVAARARSKAAMRELWAGSRFSVDFAVARTETEAQDAAQKLGLPVVVKPDRSFGGSRGVSRVASHEQLAAAFHFARSAGMPGTAVVIERCITGTEYSCEVLIGDGTVSVLCIGQKVKSLPPYRVDVSVQYPAPFTTEQECEIERMCLEATSALGLTHWVAHVEFAWTDCGPVLFELGARCGGGHTPDVAQAVSGVEEFVEVCRMACGDDLCQFRPLRRSGADYRFLIFPPGKACHFEIPDAVRRCPEVLDVEILLKPGDDIHGVRTTTDRAGFVVTRGRDRASAVEVADWACKQISVTYEDGSVSSALPMTAFQECHLERT